MAWPTLGAPAVSTKESPKESKEPKEPKETKEQNESKESDEHKPKKSMHIHFSECEWALINFNNVQMLTGYHSRLIPPSLLRALKDLHHLDR